MNTTEQEKVFENIGMIADMAVKKSLERANARFDEFKMQIEEKAKDMFNLKPILEIRINESPDLQKISQRVSPFLPRLIMNAKLGLYSMMVGPAGCGKTTAAHQVSEALGLQFGSVCLTAGASETWLFGRQTPTGFVEGSFSKIYREGGVFLADEMDAADANLLLSINTALSHSEMLNPMNGEVIKKHQSFIFIGAANTNGKGSTHLYTGRSRLDAATLDRMVIVNVTYDEQLEAELCTDKKLHDLLVTVRRDLKKEGYDEFISTRAFSNCYKQLMAGVPKQDIFDSLISNWSDSARELAKNRSSEFLRLKKGEREKISIDDLRVHMPDAEFMARAISESFSGGSIPWKAV